MRDFTVTMAGTAESVMAAVKAMYPGATITAVGPSADTGKITVEFSLVMDRWSVA